MSSSGIKLSFLSVANIPNLSDIVILYHLSFFFRDIETFSTVPRKPDPISTSLVVNNWTSCR